MKNETSVVNMSTWKAPRLPHTLDGVISKVRPMFEEWLKADKVFERNTKVVAVAVKTAFDVYAKEQPDGTRVGFARLFDSGIAEDAKTRDLADNATYNRLNYLIDKIAAPPREGESQERVTVVEKREHIHDTWLQFKKAYGRRAVPIAEVQELVKTILAEVWNEEVVDKIIAA